MGGSGDHVEDGAVGQSVGVIGRGQLNADQFIFIGLHHVGLCGLPNTGQEGLARQVVG